MSTRNLDIAPLDHDPEFTFRFLGFNTARARGGRPAACVEIIVDGVPDDVQWLARKDIENYREIFGTHPELLVALAHYTGDIAVITSEAA